MFFTKLLLIFGVLTYMGQSAHSLKCYVCNEKDHPKKCDDESLDKNELDSLEKDCSTIAQTVPPNSVYNSTKGATGCVELTLLLKKSLHNEKDEDFTIRTCYFGDPNEAKKHCTINQANYPDVSFKTHVDENCNVCTEDLCNGSTVITPLLTVLSISVIVAYFSKFI